MIGASADAIQSDAYPTRPDFALVSLMEMMSRFPARPSAAIAGSIREHLRMVATDERLAPELRQCAMRQVEDWAAFEQLSRPGPTRLAS